MMKSLFKPENSSVLIIRDADLNEAMLLKNFLLKVENGADVKFEAAYNGNHEMNGLVLTVSEVPEKKLDIPTYIPITVNVINDEAHYPVFGLNVNPADEKYIGYKIDEAKWGLVKTLFEGIGLTNASISPDGNITARNDSGSFITSSLVIPKGLFQYLNTEDSSVLNYNESLVIRLDNEPNFSDDVINSIPNDIWQSTLKPGNIDGSNTDGSNNVTDESLNYFKCGCMDSINNPRPSKK